MTQKRFEELLYPLDFWNQSFPSSLSLPEVTTRGWWVGENRTFLSIKVKEPLILRCTEKCSDPLKQ